MSNTKKGAEEAERIEREELKTAPAVVRRLITFRDFCESFYLDKMKTVGNKKGKNKQSTLDTKESHLRIHLYPRFGDTRIDEIGDVAIEDFKIAVAKLGRKPKTINNLLTTLLNILVNAKKRGHIAALPEIEWVEVPPQDFDFLDFDEGARLVEATVKVPDWRCAVMLAIKSGMRVGELRALRWEDIDFIKGKLTVCRSLWKKDCEGPPKNGKSRTIVCRRAH